MSVLPSHHAIRLISFLLRPTKKERREQKKKVYKKDPRCSASKEGWINNSACVKRPKRGKLGFSFLWFQKEGEKMMGPTDRGGLSLLLLFINPSVAVTFVVRNLAQQEEEEEEEEEERGQGSKLLQLVWKKKLEKGERETFWKPLDFLGNDPE